MDRRSVLEGTALAVSITIAGCLGDDGISNSDDGTRVIDAFVFDEVTLSSEFQLRFYDTSDDSLVAQYHGHEDGFSHWHRQPIRVPLGEQLTTRLEIIDQQRDTVPIGEDGLEFSVSLVEEGPEDLLEIDERDDLVIFEGVRSGGALLVVELFENGDHVHH